MNGSGSSFPISPAKLTGLPEWQTLVRHADAICSMHPRSLLDQQGRYESFSRFHDDLLLDFSRNRLTVESVPLLVRLAEARDLSAWIKAMFSGEAINNTERRPALHVALRASESSSLLVGGRDVIRDVVAERHRMLAFAEALRQGQHRGATGLPIRRVVNIGIGGSDLGPAMATAALRDFASGDVHIEFVSNIDGMQLSDVLAEAVAAETLFIICSKSFTTIETRLNAGIARDWVVATLGRDAVRQHFAAISVNSAAMDEFGIDQKARFPMWDWVGGRYSLWSSAGMAIACAIGRENFLELLAGARDMDEHFASADLADNLPVLLGLIGIWNVNFQGAQSQVILPYDSRLHRFPAYLQQLEMESNGKSVRRDGGAVDVATGTIVWGEPGSNAQHSFFQLLHQGTPSFAADFIAAAQGSGVYPALHEHALANMLAQAEAFARGQPADSARVEMEACGLGEADIARLLPHKVHPGCRPSNVILLRRLTPRSLGQLIALYEHKVFVQSVVWGINPFDQWGVELGKRMAGPIHGQLTGTDTGKPSILQTIREWSRAR